MRSGRASGGVDPPELTLENLDLITDFYVFDSDDEQTFEATACCFIESPDAQPVTGTEVGEWLRRLLATIRDRPRRDEINFAMIYLDKYVFRVHRDETVSGVQLCIRRVKGQCPRLRDLHFANSFWRPLLLSDRLTNGGIVLFASKPGSGKSTTMGATISERLEIFGGVCKTIEDPPELPLQNSFGRGICFQTAVDTRLPIAEQYAKPLREIALRGFPSIPGGGRTMLMLGEIRDPETAGLIVQSAVGHLILTSIHAENPEMACARLASMAGQVLGESVARDMLASSLRIVVSQSMTKNPVSKNEWDRRVIHGDLLWSHSYSSPVANIIREGQFARINSALGQQRMMMQEGMKKQTPASEMVALLSRDIAKA